MRFLGVVACLVFSTLAHAKPAEIWECQQNSYDNWKNILVVATVEGDRRSGQIEVAGTTQVAAFSVQGFNRRWDFGTAEDPVRFAFIIKPNGDAQYYDFGQESTTKPSNFMFCRQRRVK